VTIDDGAALDNIRAIGAALADIRAMLTSKNVPAEDVETIVQGVARGDLVPLLEHLMDEGFSLEWLEGAWKDVVAAKRRKIN
jgi:hypothetical protein